nr:hypothetical protein [uncultured Nitrososphaera sp.]
MEKKAGMAMFVIGIVILLGQSKVIPFLYAFPLIFLSRFEYPAYMTDYFNLVPVLSLGLSTFATILIISGVVIFYRACKQNSSNTGPFVFQDKK